MPTQSTFVLTQDLNLPELGMGGEDSGDSFWPFDGAEAGTVKIIVQSETLGFPRVFQAVEIEVIEGESAPIIFVNQSKSGAGYLSGKAQSSG